MVYYAVSISSVRIVFPDEEYLLQQVSNTVQIREEREEPYHPFSAQKYKITSELDISMDA